MIAAFPRDLTSPCPLAWGQKWGQSKAGTPLPQAAFAVVPVIHCLYLDNLWVLVKALGAETHRVSYVSTPMIIHPENSDRSVVFIICYPSVSCLKRSQSRHRNNRPVPRQPGTQAPAAELTGSALAESTVQTSQ